MEQVADNLTIPARSALAHWTKVGYIFRPSVESPYFWLVWETCAVSICINRDTKKKPVPKISEESLGMNQLIKGAALTTGQQWGDSANGHCGEGRSGLFQGRRVGKFEPPFYGFHLVS